MSIILYPYKYCIEKTDGYPALLATHWVHNEDSDQTEWMPRLIRLCWAHSHFVGFVMRPPKCAHQNLQTVVNPTKTQSDVLAMCLVDSQQPRLLHANSKDSHQTVCMRNLWSESSLGNFLTQILPACLQLTWAWLYHDSCRRPPDIYSCWHQHCRTNGWK